MSRSECPSPRPDCKYYPECFSDTDHIVPKRLGKTALAAAYIGLPCNKQQLCRRIHDEKSARGDEPLPTDEEMVAALSEAFQNNSVHLSAKKKKLLAS